MIDQTKLLARLIELIRNLSTTADIDIYMMSILSMDAYNHGYNEGMLGVGSQIGAASVFGQSNIAAGSFERGASFYAISYTIGNV